MDPEDYLSAGFDPNTLSMPKLRSVLLDLKIKYSPSAKKSELVDLYNTEIKPNAAHLLEVYRKANVPSSEHIISMIDEVVKDTEKKSEPKKSELKKAEPKKAKSKKAEPSKATNNESEDIKAIDAKDSEINENQVNDADTKAKDIEANLSDSNFSSKNVFQRKPSTPSKKHNPRKRHSPSAESSRRKILKRSGDVSIDSERSTSDIVLSEKPDDNAGKGLEDVDLDEVLKQFGSPKKKTSTKLSGSDILKHYKKSVGRKVSKKAKKEKKEKKERKMKKMMEELKKSEEDQMDVDQPEAPVLPPPADTSNENDPIIISDESEISEDDSPSPRIFTSTVHTSVAIISGPTRMVSAVESFKDDEQTINEKPDSASVSDSMSDSDTSEETIVGVMEEKVEATKEEPEEKVKVDVKKDTKTTSSSASAALLFLLKVVAVTFIASALFLFGCYRQMKMNAGFCGLPNSGKLLDLWPAVPENVESKIEPVRPYVSRLEKLIEQRMGPSCKPCPEHGTCYENCKLVCDQDYLLKKPWQSAFGLIPSEERCVLDEHAEQRRQLLMDYTIGLLRKRRGQQLSLDELYTYLKATKDNSISNHEFDEFWTHFIDSDMASEPEIHFDRETRTVSIEHRTPAEFVTTVFGRKTRSSRMEPTREA